MAGVRIINWDDVELPFGNPPSTIVPGIGCLMFDVAFGNEWHWYYKGLCGVIPIPTMRNMLRTYVDYVKRGKHQRERMPASVGKFTWGQTISTAEAAKQTYESLKSGTADETASGSEADE